MEQAPKAFYTCAFKMTRYHMLVEGIIQDKKFSKNSSVKRKKWLNNAKHITTLGINIICMFAIQG